MEQPAPGHIDFYWRPGCLFSVSLDRQLTRAGLDLERHNIWDDDRAAEFVRSVTRGNETVPTVAVGDVVLVNPTARQVAATLQERAPHLVPEGYEAPTPGRAGRLLARILGSGR